MHAESIGPSLPMWACLPFVGILLSIAVFPLAAPYFWHRNYPRVSAAWAAVFAVPFLLAYRSAALDEILHIFVLDYVPFIILLWGLFTVTGGILVRGTLPGTPAVNTLLIGIGTGLASLIGTTGAAMLLIRCVLRANAGRRHIAHTVVFFIFLVANIGGSLTPLGDPPLFLGFLHQVPFFWTLGLLPQTAFAAVLLLALYFGIDSRLARREPRAAVERPASREPLRVEGLYNLAILAGILGAVLLSGLWRPGEVELLGVHVGLQGLARDGLIVALGLTSLAVTPRRVRRDNGFGWEPIREVALLFAGIFMTIIPALAILRAGAAGPLAGLVRTVREPWQYYWATGGLSSFLDNAPTYLAFFNLQLGQFYPELPEAQAVARLVQEHGQHLEALAVGAVFMGANTYIGNAPNFMVRSMAEEAGVPMPSFFGYLFRWAVPILIPTFVLVTLVFFV
jgi:Na+/H+ antiporter NhaD/arsenite permease-like protein